MDYFTYLHISDKQLQFWKKSILIGTISFIIKSIRDRNISKTFFFSYSIKAFSMRLLATLFIRKKKAFARENFWFTSYNNQIYLTWNCFSIHVYLKDMYITLKGIGKILFVSVLRILLICEFLNFMAAFT